jgi:4-amino-4-deoxy-L-arabinose transferase-like glycosyltransferase
MLGRRMDASDRRSRIYLAAALAATGLIRLAVFPFAWNFYGDPVMRLHALAAWLEHPFFLRSFVGARQFGPLHLYLLAGTEWLTHEQAVGPRALSLVFGTLTAWPLFRLAEHRFGSRAALLSSLAFATYGLHVQASTTAVSEGVFLFFLLLGLMLLDRAAEGSWQVIFAGLSMACACAVRYDGWLYAPLSILWLAAPLRRRRVTIAAVASYVVLMIAVPIFLIWGNWVDMHDPLFLIHYIDQDHILNAHRASAAMGRFTYAAYCLAFWPANLMLEMTPLIFAACMVAVVSTVRMRSARDLWLLAVIPAGYFSLKGALLLAFHPLARFTLPTAVLLLPYTGRGLELLASGLSSRWRRVLYAATAVTAVGIPGYLAARTVGWSDSLADTMRPISPVSNLPPDLSATAAWLRENARNRKVLLESNWLYEELPIDFYADLPKGQLWNLRFGPIPVEFGLPEVLVLPKSSDLEAHGGVVLPGGDLLAYGRHFRRLTGFGGVGVFGAAP